MALLVPIFQCLLFLPVFIPHSCSLTDHSLLAPIGDCSKVFTVYLFICVHSYKWCKPVLSICIMVLTVLCIFFCFYFTRFLRFILVAVCISHLLILIAAEYSTVLISPFGSYYILGSILSVLDAWSHLILPTAQEQGTIILARSSNWVEQIRITTGDLIEWGQCAWSR